MQGIFKTWLIGICIPLTPNDFLVNNDTGVTHFCLTAFHEKGCAEQKGEKQSNSQTPPGKRPMRKNPYTGKYPEGCVE
jgi:hypothetical protein